MKQEQYKIIEYLENLKSNLPAPGGGSASALSAAQGIALVMMVANLTIGKDKYKKFEKVNMEVIEHGEVLLEKSLLLLDKDAKIFNEVAEAYKLPKETQGDKEERSKAIAQATLFATEIPIEVMEVAFEGLKLTTVLMGKSNQNVISDLGAAASNLDSAIKTSWLNVLINLSTISDKEKLEEFRNLGEKIHIEGGEIARKIYEQVIENLTV